jgi:hypothetical protein
MHPFHPVTELFEMLEGPPFLDIVNDIKAHGCREPIVLDPNGYVLHGRVREKACDLLGIIPPYQIHDGSAIQFVVSTNLRRGQLSLRQRAFKAARLMNGVQVGDCRIEVTVQEAAYLFAISVSLVERARLVLGTGNPELVAAVERGDQSLTQVANQLRKPRNGTARAKPEVIPPKKKEEPAHRSLQDIAVERASKVEQIRTLAAEGACSRDIAEIIGRSEEWCRQMIRKHGIECRGDQIVGRTRRFNSTRLLENITFDSENLTALAGLIRWNQIDPSVIRSCRDRFIAAHRDQAKFIRLLDDRVRGLDQQEEERAYGKAKVVAGR